MTRGFRDEDRRHDDDDAQVTIADVEAVRATPLALLCLIRGAQHWIPQSQITDDSEVFALGDKGKLVIKAWFARKEGLAE